MSGKAGAAKKAAAKQAQKAKNAFEARRKASLQSVLWDAEDVPRDLLKDFVPFQRFTAGDNVTRIEFSAPGHASWTAESEAFVFDLTKRNMQPVYDTAPGAGWKWNDTKKRGELFSPETRYLLARDAGSSELLGFLAFRLELEDDLEVLYVYELQVVEAARRRGLGKHMMQVAELMARKNGFQRVMLTVLKNNASAMNFYMGRLKYAVDDVSPSACGEEAAHEILSRTLHPASIELKQRIAAAFADGEVPPPELLDAPAAMARVPVPAATAAVAGATAAAGVGGAGAVAAAVAGAGKA